MSLAARAFETTGADPDAGDDKMGAAEACVLGLTMAGAVLTVEMLTAARADLTYLDAVRAGDTGVEIGTAYAFLFGASCLGGWLVARFAGRGRARRAPAAFLGLAVSVVPVVGGALTIHPAVGPFLLSWPVAPMLGILALAVALLFRRTARSGSALAREIAMAFAMSGLLGLAAGVAAARQQNAIALLQRDLRAWISLAEAALIAIPIALGLSLALRGLHGRRSLRRLIATSAVLPGLCALAVYGLPAFGTSPLKLAGVRPLPPFPEN